MHKKFSIYSKFAFVAGIAVFLAAVFGSAWNVTSRAPRVYAYNYHAMPTTRTVQVNDKALKVVLPYEKRLPRASSPFGPGMDEELLSHFMAANDLEVRFFYARSYKEALDLLKNRRCDLVVGFGGEPSKERRHYLAQSPVYASFYPVQVTTYGSAQNVYSNILRGGLKSVPASASEPLYLLDPHTYSILVPQHDDLRVKGSLTESVGYRWFWNSGNDKLNKLLADFWADRSREGVVAEMRERYYGFMPKKARYHDLRELAVVVSGRMGEYSEAIIKAAEATRLDPMLIAAVIFQESRFDPGATSFTGVRGIMQLTTETASMLNVDRLDPAQCIMGGARYLRNIYDSMAELDISEWDRWCLTLAAYNQGPANLRSALRLADSLGKKKNWTEMRRVYGQLEENGTASQGFRAREALNYVENVRYYYYVMSRLANAASLEEEHLAPLLTLTSASWRLN